MDPTGLLLIVAAGVAFYFLIIRPQKAKQRQQADMIAALAPGTEVMTTAGMFGTIAVVTDDQVSLEVSPGVFVRIVPQAIAKVIDPHDEPAGDEIDVATGADPAGDDGRTGDSEAGPKPHVD